MTKSAQARLSRRNLGYLLARAMGRWNERLYAGFCAAGHPEVRPAYGAILVPLYEEDGLRMSELARRAGSSKQTMTTMVRELERRGLVVRRGDLADARAVLVHLAPAAKRLRPKAEAVLASLDRWVARLATPSETAAARLWLSAVADSSR
jgi:DNA-binding MarR family transcriptional regulator